jgi:endogenous inhibitor of DNA gyrase (YacG/DUF329 family)
MNDGQRPSSRRARCPACGAAVPEHTARPAADPTSTETNGRASDGPPASAGSSAPFCSERCRLVDLARWLRGEHAIAGEPAHIAEDEGEA